MAPPLRAAEPTPPPPKDRPYGREIVESMSWHGYASKAGGSTTGAAKLFVVAMLAFFYPFWLGICAVMLVSYGLLMLLFWPVRYWAKKNKVGHYAEPPSP
ncbi:hypothetical protein AYO38_03010 [bacterium SCGC AG-212-C10]|nr:hypothetical protein AYO38_03010 [bacterium SCGC AG-212-C10]